MKDGGTGEGQNVKALDSEDESSILNFELAATFQGLFGEIREE